MSPTTSAASVEASRRVLLRSITEEEFQRSIIHLADLRGWLIFHARPAMDPRRRGAWRTAMEGDPGFPDLVLLRPPRLVFAELKSEMGRVSLGQNAWLGALMSVRGFGERLEVYIWRPSDQAQVEAVLA